MMQLSQRQCVLVESLCRAALAQAGNDFALARELIELGEMAQAEKSRFAHDAADKAALARAAELSAPASPAPPPAKND